MIIIACLGNPGRKYAKTRHNIGFIIGDYLVKENRISLKDKLFSSKSGTGKINGTDICVIMPQTYMNNSGMAVRKAMDHYKVDANTLLVVHDEIELPFNERRMKFGGGHKGHNGLRSIMQNIGTPDFYRLRFGVGRPDNPHMTVADYVLSKFTKEELNTIDEHSHEIYEEIVTHVNEMINKIDQ